MITDSLNTQVSASTGKQAYEIVFGQKPNYLAKLGIEGNVVLCEEDLDENENDHDGNDEDTQVTGSPAMKTSNPGESTPTNSTSHQFQTLDISQLQEVLDLNPVQATYQTITSNMKQAVEDKNQNSKRNKSDKTNQGTTSAIDSIIVNSHLDEIPMRTLDYQCVSPVSSLLGISTGSPPFISSKLTPVPSTKSSTVSSTKAPTVGESSSALVGSLLVNYSTESNTISVKNTSTTLSKIDTNSPITSSPVSTALKRTPPVTSVETVLTFSTLSSPVMSLESFSSVSAKLNPAIPVDSLSTSSTKSFPDLAESDSTALNLTESDPVTELKSTSLGLVRLSPVTLSGSSTVTFANLYSSSTGHSCDISTVPNTTLPAVLSQDTFVRNETCNINSAATSVVNTESSCQENQTSPSEMIYSTSFTSTNSSPPAACSNSGVTTSVHNANKDGTELNLSGHTAHKSFHYHKTLISTKPVQTHNDSSSSDEELFAKASRKNFKLQDLDLFLVKIRDDGTMDSLFQNQNPLPKVVRVDQLSLDNQDELVHNLGELNDLYQDEMAHIDKFLLKHRPPLRQLSKDNCDVLVQVAHRVMEAFLSKLADNKQQSFVSSKQNQSVVTSPRRIKIREIVRKRGKENAEKIKSRYAKRKRIQVADFYVGQIVTVKIPKQDRTSTDNKRIECVIVGKKGEKSPPMYQLICRHGTLERWVTASEMPPYACPIQIPRDVIDSGKKLALSQAARLSSQTKELNYCKCKAHCKNNLCKCRKQLKVCSSRCHRGMSCQNKTDQASSSREKSLSNKVSLTNNKPSDTSPISDDSGEDISESTSSDPSASPVTSSLQNLKGADCPDTSQILTFKKTSQHSGKHQPLVSNSAIEIVKKLMQKVQDASTRPIHQNEEQGSSCQPLPTSSFSDHQQDDSGLQLEQCVSIAQYDTISQVSSLSCTKSTTNINKSFLKPVATVNVQSLDLPHFGGQFKLKSDSPVVINLANTCPVDTWLMFLKALCIKDFDTFKKIIDIPVQAKSSLSDVLQCVQNSQYTQAKCILAALNRTKIINRTINLFDSEHQVVLHHISVLKHTQTSNCLSEYCKESSKINTNSETPSISTTSQVDRDNFSSQVSDWLLGAFESTCGRKLDDTIYPPEAFFVDEQTDGKGQQQVSMKRFEFISA